MACLLLAVLAIGCHAQNAKQSPSSEAENSLTPKLSRKIEVMVRSQFNIPPDMDLKLGALKASGLPGYHTLPITFSGSGKAQTVNFLLSDDGNTLARLEKFNLSNDLAAMIPIAGRPIRGDPEAKVTIINFDDLECPYCAQLQKILFPATEQHYQGLVRFVYKDFPLVGIHPWAMHAAVDAECLASENGAAYWNYVDYVHENSQQISASPGGVKQAKATLDKLAHEQAVKLNLDVASVDACTAKQDETAVRASMKEGDALGVRGTPTLFINGERIPGLLPQPILWQAIDRAIRSVGEQPPPDTPPTTAQPGQPAQTPGAAASTPSSGAGQPRAGAAAKAPGNAARTHPQ